MSVTLTKGGNVSLTKQAIDLKSVTVGLGWDERITTGADFDLDASALLLNEWGRVLSDQHFVFYGNLTSADGAVQHSGDDLTGRNSIDESNDNERIRVNLVAVPADCARIVFAVSIYDADKRGQNFGQVRNAFIRIVNDENGEEMTRYDLAEDLATETAMVFGELYRNGDEWKFRAVGQGYASGLRGIAQDFGVNVA